MKRSVNLPKYREVLDLYQEALKKMPEHPSSIELAEVRNKIKEFVSTIAPN